MKQINFVIIFIVCLALALFTLENTEPGTIIVVPGLQVQAPIAIELILAGGIGAVLAWMYSVWTYWQRLLTSIPQMRRQNSQIQQLENKVEQYEAEIQSLKLALPPSGDLSGKQAQAIAQ